MADGEGIRLLGADVRSALEKLDAQARLRVAPDLCWVVRGVPIDVRAMADAAADERNLTLGDWLTNAIIDRARLEAAQALKAATVQDPWVGAAWDETPRLAAEAPPVLLAPEALSDVISDMDTDTLEALALEALLPESPISDVPAIEARAVEALCVDDLGAELAEAELHGPPAAPWLADHVEIEPAAIAEASPPDELAAILDSVRAIVAFARLDGDTVHGPDIMLAPAEAESPSIAPTLIAPPSIAPPRALWEDIPAEAEWGADYGTVLWFVEPETLSHETIASETVASEAAAPEAVTLDVMIPEAMSFEALVQERIDRVVADESAPPGEPLALTAPEAMTEAAVVEADDGGETWLPKVDAKSKKSLLSRMFGGR